MKLLTELQFKDAMATVAKLTKNHTPDYIHALTDILYTCKELSSDGLPISYSTIILDVENGKGDKYLKLFHDDTPTILAKDIKMLEKEMTVNELSEFLINHPKYRLLTEDELMYACYEHMVYTSNGFYSKSSKYISIWNRTSSMEMSISLSANVAVTISEEYKYDRANIDSIFRKSENQSNSDISNISEFFKKYNI